MKSKLTGNAILFCTALAATSSLATEQRFADAHIHYNWDQAEIISPEQVVDKLKKANISLAIVSSTPSHLALELKKAGGDWLVPFFSPYTHELGKRDWYLNDKLPGIVEKALQSGIYRGIGEIHFMQGFPPSIDNPVFLQLMALAKKYKVPALIHIDSGNEKTFARLCQRHNDVTIVFAHAGGNLKPHHIGTILRQCTNVWIDFAARDPWRYGGLTGENGALLNGWNKLVLKYPDRIITGTDPVWRVTRTQSWDQSDDGWDHFEKLLHYHQRWISELPQPVQDKIRWDNVKSMLHNRY